LAMFVLFLGLVVRLAHHNREQKSDNQWLKQWRDVVTNRVDNLPVVGRLNAGVMLFYWVVMLRLLILLVTGIVFRRH
ncbi:formate dehydrogenase cytochrome b556 subunit, partial [Pseudomonas aeruginosa]